MTRVIGIVIEIGIATLALGLLGGCVSFEHIPVATTGCDSALAGRWLFPQPENEPAGDVRPEATVTGDCTVVLTTREGEKKPGTFKTFEFEGHRYLSLEAGTPDTVLDTNDTIIETWPANRVTLVRYRHEANRLLLWPADPDALRNIAHDRVVLHSDARIDAATGKPLPAIFPDHYVSGERQDIAAMIRSSGDALYSGMSMDKALVLTLAAEKTTP